MLRQRMRERGLQVPGSIGIFRKVGRGDRAFNIPAEIGATRLKERDVRTLVNQFAFLELHL